ncbi:MAG: hypothetical protein NT157_02580 [Candidatus Micrarchaeota archaeon]|nr:hypothetical protein [Candidatus Micrarchaeota archaeon]
MKSATKSSKATGADVRETLSGLAKTKEGRWLNKLPLGTLYESLAIMVLPKKPIGKRASGTPVIGRMDLKSNVEKSTLLCIWPSGDRVYVTDLPKEYLGRNYAVEVTIDGGLRFTITDRRGRQIQGIGGGFEFDLLKLSSESWMFLRLASLDGTRVAG